MSQSNQNQQVAPNKWLFYLLGVTVFLTLWLAFNGDKESVDDAIEVIEHNVPSKPTTVAKITESIEQANVLFIPWEQLNRALSEVKPHDAFKVHSWLVVPPVKKVKPAPPSPPVAPPVPFTYIGKLENPPNPTTVFLMSNKKLLSVDVGVKVNAQWRLDAEETNTLRFTYLPLNLTQMLTKSAKTPVAQEAAPDVSAEPNQ